MFHALEAISPSRNQICYTICFMSYQFWVLIYFVHANQLVSTNPNHPYEKIHSYSVGAISLSLPPRFPHAPNPQIRPATQATQKTTCHTVWIRSVGSLLRVTTDAIITIVAVLLLMNVTDTQDLLLLALLQLIFITYCFHEFGLGSRCIPAVI